MEVSGKSQFQNIENYCSDPEDFEVLEDLPENTRDYLESLGITKSYSANKTGQSVDDIGLKYLPSTSKVSMISENQTTENFIKEFESFYSEMMGKVQGLKNVPALKKSNNYNDGLYLEDETLFSNLKNTPEVQEQLNAIKKLDEEIHSVISDYQNEKAERLETQIEMCNEITKNNTLPERDTELFLNLCQFEFSDLKTEEKDKKTLEVPGTNKKPSSPKKKQKDFIMRNIYLAKEGVFANSSLTDEEKAKLEDILQYEDEDTQERQQRSPFTLPSTESGRSSYFSNAYCFTFDDKKKIEDIDSQLEKFKLDEKSSEKNLNSKEDSNDGDASKTIDDVRKMNHVMLEKNLKKLEDRLRELQDAENKDLETLRKIREETKINIEGNEDDVDDMPPMGDLFDLDVLNIGENELEYIDMEGLKGEDIDYEETGEEEDEDKEETNVFDEVEEGSTIDFQSK